MTRTRPIIGVTAHRGRAQWAIWDREAEMVPVEYVDAVADAGGIPVIIPGRSPVDALLVAGLQGLVLTGGPDVDPRRYGQSPHPRTDDPHADRDEAELQALSAAIALDVPVLAVCRGAQVLNVWAGGDLIQHIGDHPAFDRHGGQGRFDTTKVSVTGGSRVHALAGASVLALCHHHQAIGRLGARLSAVATAEDGAIEGIELEGDLPVVGVQWHPEEARHDGLIGRFVDMARAWAGRRA